MDDNQKYLKLQGMHDALLYQDPNLDVLTQEFKTMLSDQPEKLAQLEAITNSPNRETELEQLIGKEEAIYRELYQDKMMEQIEASLNLAETKEVINQSLAGFEGKDLEAITKQFTEALADLTETFTKTMEAMQLENQKNMEFAKNMQTKLLERQQNTLYEKTKSLCVSTKDKVLGVATGLIDKYRERVKHKEYTKAMMDAIKHKDAKMAELDLCKVRMEFAEKHIENVREALDVNKEKLEQLQQTHQQTQMKKALVRNSFQNVLRAFKGEQPQMVDEKEINEKTYDLATQAQIQYYEVRIAKQSAEIQKYVDNIEELSIKTEEITVDINDLEREAEMSFDEYLAKQQEKIKENTQEKSIAKEKTVEQDFDR